MMRGNGSGPACEVEDCAATVHAHGLCRRHYDSARRAQLSDPEAAGELGGDEADAELTLGPGRESAFATEEERRAAWERRKAIIMETYLTPPLTPGRRPDAWWRYEAGRPQYLSEADWAGDWELAARQEHENEVESITFMATNGHLTALELEIIERKGAEALARLDTDHEQLDTIDPDHGGDKLDVTIADAVRGARERR